MLNRVRTEWPILPIFLYVPRLPDVSELILHCGSIQGIRVRVQSASPTAVAALRGDIRKLLDTVHLLVLQGIVRKAVHDTPRAVTEFALLAVRSLHSGRGMDSFTVETLSAELRVSTRTLHRYWASTSLPQPKQMLNWIILLFVSYTAAVGGISVPRIAASIGLSRQRLYRIRKRLTAGECEVRLSNIDQAFDLVLCVFLRKCGMTNTDINAIRLQVVA